ncbi:MAG: hypothetical protein EPN97_09010 [Alphaproteobacteria bacterium]|nr:MAG: hypothetical protein EPN97_09010 [Alphaproteobacteria bacterium]
MNFSKDKHIIIPICLALAGIVAWRSWQDLHPPPRPQRAFFDTYDFVRSDEGLAAAAVSGDSRNDDRALVVWAGDFKMKGGKLSLAATPVKAVSLPQREIILLYTLDAMPKSVEELAENLAANAETWKNQGDLVNDIYLDGPDDKKGLTEMLEQCNPLREKLHNGYWFGIFLSRKAIETLPDRQKQIDNASKSLRTMIFNAKESQQPDEKLEDMIQKLDKYELPFMLVMEDTPDFARLQQRLKPEPERFAGFILIKDKTNTQ